MKKTTFRLTKLALMVGVVGLGLNANAVYNLYSKDGLTLDINGQLDVQATKQDAKHRILADADGTDYYWSGTTPYRDPMASVKNDTDKKTRLDQNHGVSYIDFRGSQKLPNDWRVTGNVGVGYSDSRNLYLSNSSLSLDKKNIGAVTLGRQYLHTNYVNRTGTGTPLDIFSTSALRLDYYGIKGLQASTYYSFAGYNDVRTTNNTEQESGYGASVSYRVPFAKSQSVRFGAGFTESKFNPVIPTSNFAWIHNSLNQYPEKAQGMAGSIEYQFGKLLIAGDIGKKKETMSSSTRTPLDKKDTDYLGAKIAFDINPVWQISAGYGIKKAKSTLKAGAEALSTDLNALNSAYSYVDGDELYLFDKAETKESYIQTDYRMRPNFRVYGRYDNETTTYKVAGTDISKLSDKNARIGIVFSF